MRLPPFLAFLRREPILAALVEDYGREVDRAFEVRLASLQGLASRIAELYSQHQADLNAVRNRVAPSDWESIGGETLAERIGRLPSQLAEDGKQELLEGSLATLDQWLGLGDQPSDPEALIRLVAAKEAVRRLRDELKGPLALREQALVPAQQQSAQANLNALFDTLKAQMSAGRFVAGGDINAARGFDVNYQGRRYEKFFASVAKARPPRLPLRPARKVERTFWGKGEYHLDHFFVERARRHRCASATSSRRPRQGD